MYWWWVLCIWRHRHSVHRFCTNLNLIFVPSLCLSRFMHVKELAQLCQPSLLTSHCVAPQPPHLPAVLNPWRVHAHPDRMLASSDALRPLLPIATTSFSLRVPALADGSSQPFRPRPAPHQHGGWDDHYEGWHHQCQHAGLAGLLGRVHPGQHLEHS